MSANSHERAATTAVNRLTWVEYCPPFVLNPFGRPPPGMGGGGRMGNSHLKHRSRSLKAHCMPAAVLSRDPMVICQNHNNGYKTISFAGATLSFSGAPLLTRLSGKPCPSYVT